MVIVPFKTLCRLLGVDRAAGGHENRVDMAAGLIAYMLPAVVKRLDLHYAAAAAAVWIVVHLLLLVCCIVSYLVALYFYITPLLCPADYALGHYGVYGVREQCHYVYFIHFTYLPEG